MTVFKYFPILLMIGTIAIYCTGNYASEAPNRNIAKNTSISIKTTAIGKDKITALENAEISAFQSILFKGIPGSTAAQPLIGEKESSKNLYQNYCNDLLKKKRYKNFIQSMEFVYDPAIEGEKKIDLALEIDIEALKKDLRKNMISSI